MLTAVFQKSKAVDSSKEPSPCPSRTDDDSFNDFWEEKFPSNECTLTKSTTWSGPQSFMCPITHDIMQKPVLLISDGISYERSALEAWLKDNGTSPFTGAELSTSEFRVNYALQNSIDEWQQRERELLVKSRRSSKRSALDSEAAAFLDACGLKKLHSVFAKEGFATMDDLCRVTLVDLLAMAVPRGHSRRLLHALADHREAIAAKKRKTASFRHSLSDEKVASDRDILQRAVVSGIGVGGVKSTTSVRLTAGSSCFESYTSGKRKGRMNINVILLGDANTGKTCLRKRLALDQYVLSAPTTGVEVSTVFGSVADKSLQVTVWDPAGQERYAPITKSFFRKCHAAAVAFCPDDITSWKSVEYWLKELDENAPDDIEVALICNKCDLILETDDGSDAVGAKSCDDAYWLLIDKATRIANERRIPFYCCSAKTGECVVQAFEGLLEHTLLNPVIAERLAPESWVLLPSCIGKEASEAQFEAKSTSKLSSFKERLKRLTASASTSMRGSVLRSANGSGHVSHDSGLGWNDEDSIVRLSSGRTQRADASKPKCVCATMT